jgi:hypothetical protein
MNWILPCFFLFFCAYGLLTASVKLALVLCYQAQRLHMHCLFPPLPHPLLNLAFCDCACVLSESIFVHVYGDGPWMDVTSWIYLPSSRLRWGHGQLHAFTGYALLMHAWTFFFTGGRCNYHSKLKKKTLHGLKALNYLGFGIARNLIVLSRIFQLKKKLYLIIIG